MHNKLTKTQYTIIKMTIEDNNLEIWIGTASLAKTIQNLTVTGSKQNQMVSSAAGSTVLM